MGDSPDEIAAQVAAAGFTESIEEPRDRDYAYIAGKIADRAMPIHYSDDAYDGRGREDVAAMARVHVYRHVIEGYDSWPRLHSHLQHTDGVLDALGLTAAPSRETLRRSWHQQFDADAHERFRQLALDLREEIGWGMDGVLLAMGVDDDSQSYPEFSEEGIRERAKDRAYERIRPILTDIVDFDRADNTSVPTDDLTDYAGWLCRRRQMSPESMTAYVADEDLGEQPFSPETYRRAIRNKEREQSQTVNGRETWVPPHDWSIDLTQDYGGTDDWHSTTEEGIGRFVEELHDQGVIDGEVPVCIDASIRPWHKHPRGADDRPDGVYREEYFDTNYGYKDISANAIIDGRSVVLANISMVPGDQLQRALRYLIDRARDLVDVEAFYADSAFPAVKMCRYIDTLGETYVLKKAHSAPVVEEFDDFSGKADWCKYTMRTGTSKPGGIREHTTNLFAVEKRSTIDVKQGETRHDDHSQSGLDDFLDLTDREGQLSFDDLATDEEDVEYVAFITNSEITSEGIDPAEMPIGHDSSHTVWGLAERYRKRWSIETAFRQVKYQFLPNTRSRDLGTRRFCWMMGLLLLNAWATVNILVQTWAGHTFPDDETDPPVVGKEMLEELAQIDYG